MERDKVNSFWEITKRQLEETRSTIRNKERELEDSEERHQVEIKVGAGVFPLQCMRLRSMNTFIADTSLTKWGQRLYSLQSEDKNTSSQRHRRSYTQYFGYWLVPFLFWTTGVQAKGEALAL